MSWLTKIDCFFIIIFLHCKVLISSIKVEIFAHLNVYFYFSFETDPRIRHTFWTIMVGGTFLFLNTIGISQGQVQRYLSCKNEAQAKG